MAELVGTLLAAVLPLVLGALLGRYGRVNRLRHIERLAEVAGKLPERDRTRCGLLAQANREVELELARLQRAAAPGWLVVAYWLAFVYFVLTVGTGLVLDGPQLTNQLAQEVSALQQASGYPPGAAIALVTIGRFYSLVFLVAVFLAARRSWHLLGLEAAPLLRRADAWLTRRVAAPQRALRWFRLILLILVAASPAAYLVLAFVIGSR